MNDWTSRLAAYDGTLLLWGQLLLGALVIVAGALLLHAILKPIALRLTRFSSLLTSVVQRCANPMRWAMPVAGLLIAAQGVPDTVPGIDGVQHLLGVLTIVAIGAVASGAITGVANGVAAMHRVDVEDNLEARRIQTQTKVLARIAKGAVMLTALAFVLMTFPRAKQVGASLLASAGIAGLVFGLAARSVFGNLLAGLQIAMAQPIRLDDVLIIQGEWGRVEEITSTYVVLKVWDERRLVIPLQWFIENPFQNWTRTSASILGTVMLWVDFTLPVSELREKAAAMCKASAHWDGRVCGVQVVETTERTMQIRVLVSAKDSGKAFDLRCELREGLIAWLQKTHPQSLPRVRALVEDIPAPSAPVVKPSLPPSPAP
ncbi:mechanosensitive ion channel domain-containing protein [Mitsuaria sp. GD03876]|uniref:mechanosensitive ion channel family protein n=1 Tax=Mitsuaria sp. GD03876 TaxID=2975399 RepID=UPI002449759B|nr:mechanosensitive ion channel domain-containing protein [Mitsuaria sp. GD03876]MDH0866091.1 mechanosensitive ion channel family protein [Mitsuaria sp. GD03876]